MMTLMMRILPRRQYRQQQDRNRHLRARQMQQHSSHEPGYECRHLLLRWRRERRALSLHDFSRSTRFWECCDQRRLKMAEVRAYSGGNGNTGKADVSSFHRLGHVSRRGAFPITNLLQTTLVRSGCSGCVQICHGLANLSLRLALESS